MAIDEEGRRSAITDMVKPDGTIDAGDRQWSTFEYTGIAAAEPEDVGANGLLLRVY